MHQGVQIERIGSCFDRRIDHFFDGLQCAGRVDPELQSGGVKRHRFLGEIAVSGFRFRKISDQLLAAFFVCFAIQTAFVLSVEREEKNDSK